MTADPHQRTSDGPVDGAAPAGSASGRSPEDEAGSPAAMRYVVRGRVQGVGFRWWCRRVAEALGVRGSVRNRADGAVEVLASAEPSALAALEERLRSGPSLARVEEVRAAPAGEPVAGEGFVIAS